MGGDQPAQIRTGQHVAVEDQCGVAAQLRRHIRDATAGSQRFLFEYVLDFESERRAVAEFLLRRSPPETTSRARRASPRTRRYVRADGSGTEDPRSAASASAPTGSTVEAGFPCLRPTRLHRLWPGPHCQQLRSPDLNPSCHSSGGTSVPPRAPQLEGALHRPSRGARHHPWWRSDNIVRARVMRTEIACRVSPLSNAPCRAEPRPTERRR